jgi:hypothetical protein
MTYFIAFIIVYALHVLLKLNWYMTAVLCVFAVFMVPRHKRRYEVFKKNKRRFFEASGYLDTLLYSFVKEEKVVLAISDVSQTLAQGEMKKLVEKAFDYMQMTFNKIEVLEEGLRMIEAEYPCQRIKDVHHFMIHVEYYGGDIEKPVSLRKEFMKRYKEDYDFYVETEKLYFPEDYDSHIETENLYFQNKKEEE